MKTKLIVIGVVAAVTLSGLWFVALWSPRGGKLDEAKATQQVAEKNAADLRTRLAHLKKLEANAAVLERDRDKLAAALPDGDLLDQFILAVNEKATASGVSFVSVAPTEPITAATPGGGPAAATAPLSIGLQFQVTGDYHAILRFVEALRVEGERIVTIENVTMNKGASTDNTLTAALAGKMFVNRPLAAAPAPVPATQTASTPG